MSQQSARQNIGEFIRKRTPFPDESRFGTTVTTQVPCPWWWKFWCRKRHEIQLTPIAYRAHLIGEVTVTERGTYHVESYVIPSIALRADGQLMRGVWRDQADGTLWLPVTGYAALTDDEISEITVGTTGDEQLVIESLARATLEVLREAGYSV